MDGNASWFYPKRIRAETLPHILNSKSGADNGSLTEAEKNGQTRTKINKT